MGIARCLSSPGNNRHCTIVLSDANWQKTPLTLRIRALYKAVDVNIEARAVRDDNFRDLPGTARLKDAQIMVDSTGKANDLLRRIQVRVPARPQSRQAEFAIQAKDSLCKLLNVGVGSVQSDDPLKCRID